MKLAIISRRSKSQIVRMWSDELNITQLPFGATATTLTWLVWVMEKSSFLVSRSQTLRVLLSDEHPATSSCHKPASSGVEWKAWVPALNNLPVPDPPSLYSACDRLESWYLYVLLGKRCWVSLSLNPTYNLSDSMIWIKLLSCSTGNKSSLTLRWARATKDNIRVSRFITLAHPT